MTDTNIPFPRRGLNDNWAYGEQPIETAFEAQNMRGIDPTNGRTRGSQRAGMSKHKAQIVGSDRPVRLVRSAVYDAKGIIYEALQGDLDTGGLELNTEEWAKTPEVQSEILNTETDLSGNVYALSAKAVEKRNPDGVLLWSFAVPVANPAFTLGPLVVDADLSIYVSVEGGAPTANGAAIYKIDQIPIANSFDTEPQLGWEYPLDRWIRELRIHQGTLKCLVQNDLAYRSSVLTMVNIGLSVPSVEGEIEVPYPSTCMVIKDDGAAVTGHPPFADRDSSPNHPGVGISLEEWTSGDLDDYQNRVWSSFRASDLLDNGIGDGESVSFWPDRTGKGRSITQGSWPNSPGTGPGVPTLRAEGSTGLPSVFFDGSQGLFSAPGGGTDAQREACKSMVPNHGDGAYCIMIVCRPSSQKAPEEKDNSGADVDARRWLFNQFTHTKYQGDSSPAADQGYTEAHRSGMIVNSGAFTGTGTHHYTWSTKDDQTEGLSKPGYLRAFTPSSGNVSGTSTVDGLGANPDYSLMPTHRGAGWAGWPLEGQFDDPTSTDPGEGLCVITFLNCGGLDEAFEVTGDFDIGVDFVAPSGTFDRYPIGATGVIWSAGVSDTVTVLDGETLTLGTGNIPTGSTIAAHVVWERNWMTRSTLRINGEPIDRWEALPMSYAGPGNAGATTRSANLNVEQNPTGLGYPLLANKLLGFIGEIMEIEVFGRRQKNADRVDLGGTDYVLYPSVLTHPMYAANGHSSDTQGDDAGSNDKAFVNVGANVNSLEIEKLEGEKMHRHGIASRLPATSDTYPHPHTPNASTFVNTFDIPFISSLDATGQAWIPRKRFTTAMIAKHDQAGKMLWCLVSAGASATGMGDIFSHDIHGNTAANGITDAEPTAGLALTSTGDIYVAGPGGVTTPADSEQFAYGLIVDVPTTARQPQLQTVGFWKFTGADPDAEFQMGYAEDKTIHLRTDAFDNLYAPVPPGSQYLSADAKDAIRIFGRDLVTDPMVHLNRVTTLGGTTKYQNAHSLALPPANPDYTVSATEDFATNGIQRAEFVYLGLEEFDNDAPDKVEALAKWRITSADTRVGSQGRVRELFAISGGVGYTYDSVASDWDAFDAGTDPSLSADAHYFWAFNFKQKIYVGDGLSQMIYDPKAGTLTKWESGVSGTLPEKCALGAVYRGRVVLARPADQPQNWYMSAVFDADNWDFFPPTQTADMAVFGNNTLAAQCPDIINTLIPSKDDYMIFGCDHSIWLLRGDPVDFGQFDEISLTIGMAFGNSWCKDPTDILYFFGSKGGVYRMVGDSPPQHLSDARDGQDTSIQDRLRDIDLSAFRMELVWDFERQGLIVLQIPYSETITAASKAWFWDIKNNAWWEDLPGSETLQPYSSFVVDGDEAADRRVVYGCEDGFVRELDSAASDDDGTAIDSYVTIGPIAAGGDAEIVLNRIRAVLAREQDGCHFNVFVSDVPGDLEDVVASGDFQPGMGDRISVNRRGSFVWVQLRNTLASQRWAIEELQAHVVKAGLRRAR